MDLIDVSLPIVIYITTRYKRDKSVMSIEIDDDIYTYYQVFVYYLSNKPTFVHYINNKQRLHV